MEVNVEDVSPVKKTLKVTVPASEVDKALDRAYKGLKTQVRVKGFRPGKAPRSVLEGMYKKDVSQDVASKLVNDSFPEALRETELRVVGTPDVDPPEPVQGRDFTYEAEVEVFPELPELNLAGLELKRPRYEATQDEIDNQLEMLRKNMGHLKPVEEDRPVAEGDFALIDYEGADEQSQRAGVGQTEDFTLEIGSGKILKEFDEQVVGMKPGETRIIEVTFPEDYFNKELAGKNVRFSVTLKEIREQELPPLDDELAKDMGEYETLDELKDVIRKHLQEGYDKRADQVVEEQIYRQLLDQVDFEVPDTLVEHELESMMEESERALAYRNMTFEDAGTTKEEMRERYRDTAVKQVRRYIILDTIIDQEDLELSEETMDEAFENMAAQVRQPKDVVRQHYERNQEQLSMFRHTLLQKEALDHIKRLADLKTVPPEEIEEETENAGESEPAADAADAAREAE
ncbi:MAG: trigger factor [Desulfatibacillaceae bacterium]